jgi:hypothetical protein
MAGGQQLTSAQGTLTPAKGDAVSGEEAIAAAGSPENLRQHRLNSRKVGGGSATHAISGQAITSAFGLFTPVPSKTPTGQVAALFGGTLGRERSMPLVGQGTSALTGAMAGSVESTPTGNFTSTTFTLTTTAASGTYPFTVGLGFKKGDTTSVVCDLTNYQVVVKRRWNDNTVKHAIISGRAVLTQNVARTVTISTGSPQSGTALTSASIQAAAPTASVQCGAIGTVSLSSLLASPFRTFISGHEMVECHYRADVGGGTQLSVWFHVRLYADGRKWVRAICENGYLDNGSGAIASHADQAYAATVTVGGATVFLSSLTHHSHTRWMAEGWIGGDPAVTALHDVAYLRSTKLVPNYGWTAPSTATLNALTQSYTPMSNGNISPAMTDTGQQPHIGILPQWDAFYAASGDARALRSMLANSSHLNSYAIVWRSKTSNKVIKPSDFGNWTFDGPGQGGGNPGGAGLLVWDHAHHPGSGYLPYLLTGDYWHYETMLFQASVCYLFSTSLNGLSTNRLILGQTRGRGWSLRTLSQACGIAPSVDNVPSTSDGLLAEYQALLTTNINDLNTQIARPSINTLGYLYESSVTLYTIDGGNGFIAPWQQNFGIQSLGFGSDLEPLTTMTNYITVRNWMYKGIVGLLGDSTGYYFNRATSYTIKTSTGASTDPTTWFDTWAQVLAGTQTFYSGYTYAYTLGGTSGGNPASPSGYWGNLLPAIAYAVDHEAPGADLSYTRIVSATNWPGLRDAGFDNYPNWGVKPRVPAWRRTMAQWQWKELSGSSMSVTAAQPTVTPAGASGPASRINTWTGLACDPASGRLWSAANGGHGDYAGNEVVYMDLWQDSPTWAIIRQPTPAAQVTANTAFYSDGRPTSGHNYFSAFYVPAQNRVFRFGSGFRWSDGSSSDATYAFNVASGDWDGAGTDQNTNPAWAAAGSLTKGGHGQDAYTGDVYFVGSAAGGSFRRFNALAGTFSTLASVPGVNNDYASQRAFAYDHNRGRLMVMGDAYSATTGGRLWTNNGGTGTWSTFSFSSSAMAGANGFGADYDPALDRVVVKTNTGAEVLLVNPATFAITAQATTGGTPPNPVSGSRVGVFGLFRKVTALGGYVYYPLYSGQVWFLATE